MFAVHCNLHRNEVFAFPEKFIYLLVAQKLFDHGNKKRTRDSGQTNGVLCCPTAYSVWQLAL